LPGTSEARFMPQRPEDAAFAAAEGTHTNTHLHNLAHPMGLSLTPETCDEQQADSRNITLPPHACSLAWGTCLLPSGVGQYVEVPQLVDLSLSCRIAGEGMQMPGMRSRHVDSMDHFYSRPQQGQASSSGWHREEMQGHTGRGAMGPRAAGPSTRFPSQAALAPFLQVIHRSPRASHPAPVLVQFVELHIHTEGCEVRYVGMAGKAVKRVHQPQDGQGGQGSWA